MNKKVFIDRNHYYFGDYYQDKAYESVSNVVSTQVETMNMSKE